MATGKTSPHKLSLDQLDPRNNLQLYSRDVVKNADIWTPKAIREEYSRLRSIARKRLERLEKLEPDSYAYRHNVGVYKPLKELTQTEVIKLLPELAQFIAAKTGTVTGIRQARLKAIEKLQEHGYEQINESNYKTFASWMEKWRSEKLTHSIGSIEVVEAFEFTVLHDIRNDDIDKDFQAYLKDIMKAERYAERMRKNTVTSEKIRAKFGFEKAPG